MKEKCGRFIDFTLKYGWGTWSASLLTLVLLPRSGVQRRMISVDNFFVFLRLLFFALLLLYAT